MDPTPTRPQPAAIPVRPQHQNNPQAAHQQPPEREHLALGILRETPLLFLTFSVLQGMRFKNLGHENNDSQLVAMGDRFIYRGAAIGLLGYYILGHNPLRNPRGAVYVIVAGVIAYFFINVGLFPSKFE